MLKSGQNTQKKLISYCALFGVLATCFSPLVGAKAAKSVKGYEDCGNNYKAQQLAELIVNDNDQKRVGLTCSSLLSQVAQQKADEMAAQGKVSHKSDMGTPNERLIDSGYSLYLPEGAVGSNHVEAILGGYSTAEEVLDGFKNSYQHRVHLFAEHEFFLQQDEIGVGYAYNWESPHLDYWVVYIASDEPAQ